jgi:adenylyl cyclase-associated protein
MVKQAFAELKELISTATKSVKPTASDLPLLLAPLQTIMSEISGFRDSNRSSPCFSHLSMISEAIPALGWVVVEPTPAPYVAEMKEAGQFYANRVIKEFKDKDKRHVEWVSSFLALLSDLQAYVKQHHTTGLVWNPKGASATAPKSPSKNPAPLVPPKGSPSPAPGNFLKELNGGTSGLRKVDKSEMTHKNPELRATSIVKESDTVKKAPPVPSKAPSKPPKLALEGNKWVVENYTDESSIVIDKTEIRHTVYIYNCTNSTILIKGKVNAISVDACKKTGVLIDSVVSTIDIVNGKSISVQITGKAPTMAVDKTDGLQVYLSKDSIDLELLSAKSSAINFMVPTADGDFVEHAAPEQLKIQFWGNKLLASAVEHRG